MVKEVFCGGIIIIFYLLTAEHGPWERLQNPLLSMVAPDALMRGRITSVKKQRGVRMSLPYPEDLL